jgi:hypothetical protein
LLARAFEALREQSANVSIITQLDFYAGVSRSCFARTGQARCLRSSQTT